MKNLCCLNTLILLATVIGVVSTAGCRTLTPPPEELVAPPRPTGVYPTPTPVPPVSAYPRIAAMQDWQSLTYVEIGDIIHVEAIPGATWHIGEAAGMTDAIVDADGLPEARQRSAPLPEASLGALIGRIGEGPAFLVGSQLTFTADQGGELIMRTNEAFLDDNSEALTVKIVIQHQNGKLLHERGTTWGHEMAENCSLCELGISSDTLSWRRTQSENNGSAIWAIQKPFADMGGCDHLILSFSVRVNNQALPNSGWWSEQNHSDGEYPAKVMLKFAGANNEAIMWSHGFLYQHDGSTRLTNYTLVPKGEWTSYEVNLFAPTQWMDANGHALPAPIALSEVWVGGNGWDFDGAIRNLQLLGCQND